MCYVCDVLYAAVYVGVSCYVVRVMCCLVEVYGCLQL